MRTNERDGLSARLHVRTQNKNVAFTYSYSQPEAYQFCQDSVLAPLAIADDLLQMPLTAAKSSSLAAIDVCAGCGVMAFELLHALGNANRRDTIASFDFLEIQTEFEPHFRENLGRTQNSTLPVRWINSNYSILESNEFSENYDLIIANPPYFRKDEGSLSDNQINNRARFFLDSSLETLLRGFRNSLKPAGRAYFLMKSGKEHGRDAFTSARVELFDCHFERLTNVRGTDLIKMERPPS